MGGFVKDYGPHDDCEECAKWPLPEDYGDRCQCEELYLEQFISHAEGMRDAAKEDGIGPFN